MQVSEQTDSLRVLGTDPVDYLVSPRVLACMVAGPILCLMCFAMGKIAAVLFAFLNVKQLAWWVPFCAFWYLAMVVLPALLSVLS